MLPDVCLQQYRTLDCRLIPFSHTMADTEIIQYLMGHFMGSDPCLSCFRRQIARMSGI